ncbi:MAG: hypothetical protein WAX89_02920 [Alphaproteobacteria bacterium]
MAKQITLNLSDFDQADVKSLQELFGTVSGEAAVRSAIKLARDLKPYFKPSQAEGMRAELTLTEQNAVIRLAE